MNANIALGVPGMLESDRRVAQKAKDLLGEINRPGLSPSWFCSIAVLGIVSGKDKERSEELLRGLRAVQESNSVLVFNHHPNWEPPRTTGRPLLKLPGATKKGKEGHLRPADTVLWLPKRYFQGGEGRINEVVPFHRHEHNGHVQYSMVVVNFEGEIREGMFEEKEKEFRSGADVVDAPRTEMLMEPHLSRFGTLLRREEQGGIFRGHRDTLRELVQTLAALGNKECVALVEKWSFLRKK